MRRLLSDNRIIRFLCAGATAAATQITLFYVLFDVVHLWYLYATTIAFVVTLLVSFTLQKYWTFRSVSHEHVRSQGLLYIAVSLVNLTLNGILMHVFVDSLGIFPVVAQALCIALIAIDSFIASSYIFRTRTAR